MGLSDLLKSRSTSGGAQNTLGVDVFGAQRATAPVGAYTNVNGVDLTGTNNYSGVRGVDVTGGNNNDNNNNNNYSGYSGPNYTAIINSAATAGKRGAPGVKNQITGAVNNAIGDYNRAGDMLDAGDNLAGDTLQENLRQQHTLANDQWYRFTQALQNSSALQQNQYSNGLNGSGVQRLNSLYRLTDDQGDQNILENLRQGDNSYYQDYYNQMNANQQTRIQNELNLRSQLDSILLQSDADTQNYINNILSQMSGYGVGSSYMDKNGNLTQAGKSYVEGLGLNTTVNPDGSLSVDTSSYIPDSFKDIYVNLGQASNHPFLSYDLLGTRRTAEETNAAMQKRAESNQRGYNNAKTNPLYYAENLGRRYG